MASSTSVRVDWLDRAAMGASAACLLHCVALPVVLAMLPLVGTVIVIPESFHLWMLVFAVPVALVALIAGRALHGRNDPLIVGLAGLVGLASGALVAEGALETGLTVVGGVALASAHAMNARFRRSCCIHP